MPLTMVDPVEDGDDITATLWNAEFQNILNNPMDLIDPMVLNNTGSPTTNGQLSRNGTVLQYNNGSVRTISFISDLQIVGSNAEPAVANTGVETSLYPLTIPAGTIGTTGMLHLSVVHFVTSMLAAATLQFRHTLGATMFYGPTLTNGTAGTINNFGIREDIRISARGNANSQAWSATSVIGADDVLINWGTSGQKVINRAGLLAENMTAAVNYQLNALWSAGSASNSMSSLGIEIHKVRS